MKNLNNNEFTWQQHLQEAITDPVELITLLELDHKYTDAAIQANQLFPLKVPRTFLGRIEKGNIHDPLLRQIFPLLEELNTVVGYSLDPVGEQAKQTMGMIHKYHGRNLLMINGHCAVNCRYCFRRHYPYENNRLNRLEWEQVIAHIAANKDISEVIYSGGDPLASTDKQLKWLTQKIAQIGHVKRLRIHTRLPVVIPNRITENTLKWMSNTKLSSVIVLHINHANELKDSFLIESIQRMKAAGLTVLNQAVLLRGVNDTVTSLVTLSEALFNAGVLPYYLHVLDRVIGSAHFDTDEQLVKILQTQITARLPGYLVPKVVREVANQPFKVML